MGLPLTTEVRVAPGHGVAASQTHARTRVVLDPDPFGELWIYAPTKEGLEDSFVLRDTAATTEGDALYWSELKAVAATGDGHFVLTFNEATNTGGRRGDLDGLAMATYTLVHRPLGDDRVERTLFAGRTGRAAFPGGRPPRPSQGRTAADILRDETRPPSATDARMKWVVAVEPRLSDEVRFPPPVLDRLGLDDDVELQRPDVLRPAPGTPDGDPLAGPGTAWSRLVGDGGSETPDDSRFLGRPVPVAVRERAWANGAPPAAPGGADADAESDADGPGERWVTVFSLATNPAYVRGDPGQQMLRDRGTWHPNVTERVGVWHLPGDGTCRLALYPEGGAEDDVPDVVGGAAPFFLVDVGLPARNDSDHTAYAHVSVAPLPRLRADDLEGKLRDVGTNRRASYDGEIADRDRSALTPLDLVPKRHANWSRRDEFYERHHVSWDGVWAWYLPDPVRVTERMAELAEAELVRYQAWKEAAEPGAQHSGFVAATCYDPDHGRDHLTQDLARSAGVITAGDPSLNVPDRGGVAGALGLMNVVEMWDGFDPYALGIVDRPPGGEAVTSRASVSGLRHFQYGLFRQRVYLQHRVRVAGARLAAWVGSPSFGEHLRDLGVAHVAGAPDEASVEAVARALRVGSEAGAGAAVLLTWLHEAGVIERLPAAPEPGALDERLGLGAEPWSVGDVLDAPLFKVLWLATEKGGEAAVEIAEAAGGSITLAARTGVLGDFEARLLGVFFGRMAMGADFTATGDGRTFGPLRLETWDADAGGRPFLSPGGVPDSGAPAPQTRWRVSVGVVPERVALFVGGLDIAITATGIGVNGGRGEFGWGDAVAFGQVLTEGVGFVDTAAEAGVLRLSADRVASLTRVGRQFARASVLLEGAAAGLGVYAAYANRLNLGVQSVVRRDTLGMTGAAVGGAGAMLIAQAALGGVGALVSSPAAAVGVALVAVGWAVAAVGEQRLSAEQRADDPLARDLWLARRDVWGRRYDRAPDRNALLRLVRPGWGPSGGGAVLAPTLLGRGGEPGLTAAFVERAFAFPVRVRAEPGPGGAVRLTLAVVPRYLPAAGAVAVRASVSYRDEFDLEKTVPVAFVVRYERPERGPLRYAVRDGAGWAPSVPVASLGGLGGGLAGLDALAVHVGPGWGALPDGPGGLAGAAGRLVAAGRTPTRSAVYGEDRAGRAAQAALRSSGHVPDAARLDATPGLAAALGAGRFTVTGFAVFDPARPLAPAVPTTRPGPGELYAVEDIGEPPLGVVYPDDFS